MNKKQETLLNKEFKVNDHFCITRSDYEDMPCAMMAWNWTDEQMQKLASNIAVELCEYDENDEEGMDDDFWKTMENVAVGMGMVYYEDMTDEEFNKQNEEWERLNNFLQQKKEASLSAGLFYFPTTSMARSIRIRTL